MNKIKNRLSLIPFCLFISFLFTIFPFSCVSQTVYHNPTDTSQRLKVALVMSGGGAKGAAYVGALKVLEEASIPIDIICGTSMGALIGGLYSIGYNSTMLDSLIRSQDWSFLLSDRIDPGRRHLDARTKEYKYLLSVSLKNIKSVKFNKQGFIKGQNLSNLFSALTVGYHDSISFDSLPIRYAAVATDLVKNKQYVFHSGKLMTAIRASMSIPAVFSPVIMDSMVLVDGGLKDNFPVDVARQMGADVVIGISVQDVREKSVNDFSSTVDIISSLVDAPTVSGYTEHRDDCDVFIKVNVDGYNAMSFNASAIDTLIERGYEAAMNEWDYLMAVKRGLGYDTTYRVPQIRTYKPLTDDEKVCIGRVRMENLTPYDSSFLTKRYHIDVGDSVSIRQIEKVITELRGNFSYNDAVYNLSKEDADGKYSLEIVTEGKKAAQISIGARADNEEKVSMILNGVFPLNTHIPTTLDATIRLGNREMVRLQANVITGVFGAMSLAYSFKRNDVDVYRQGDKFFNTDYNVHEADIGFMNYGFRNMLLDFFVRWNHVGADDLLVNIDGRDDKFLNSKDLLSYNFKLHFDSREKAYFAHEGIHLRAEYSIYTDNFYKYRDKAPLMSGMIGFEEIIPLGKYFALIPSSYTRMLFGDNVPLILDNYAGGVFSGHYVEQHLPLAGVGHVERMSEKYISGELGLRARFLNKHYIGFSASAFNSTKDVRNLLTKKIFLGARLSYGYESILGPLAISFNYSNFTKQFYIFANIGYEF